MPETVRPRPPSVDALTKALASHADLARLPRPLLVKAARDGIASDPADATRAATEFARSRAQRMLQEVINATGVLLHTNLGRAPQSRRRDEDGAHDVPIRYRNVEFSLEHGRRGSRREIASDLLSELTGAESALVVNNCAAALVLVLAALGEEQPVIVSRGELVEIGGGFRIPEVMEQSGARLVEVGTTNRTRLGDYRGALDRVRVADELATLRDESTRDEHGASRTSEPLVLKVHQSNYRIVGFTEETSIAELASLGAPVIADIGSGLLDERLPWLTDASGHTPSLPWLRGEPGARQALEDGAALVVFSGDKLLGGPQAGIIVGRNELVDRCARHPLMRALRPGWLVLDQLQSVLLDYLRRDPTAIPFWEMAARTVAELESRAGRIVSAIGVTGAEMTPMDSVPGGGTLPDRTIPSFGIRLQGDRSDMLRRRATPIVGRVEAGATFLDLRTIDRLDDEGLIVAIKDVLTTR